MEVEFVTGMVSNKKIQHNLILILDTVIGIHNFLYSIISFIKYQYSCRPKAIQTDLEHIGRGVNCA